MDIIEFAKGYNEVYVLKNIGNRGDKLIELGMLQYFSNYKIKVNLLEFNDTSKEGDLLFVSGGGAFCNNWSHMIQAVKKRYHQFKKIVLLPSTFDLSSKTVRDWASNLPDHVIVFCREEESHKQMSQVAKNVYLSIDTAFYFNFEKYKKQGYGNLVCFRKDSESSRNVPFIKDCHHREDLSSGNSEDYKYFLNTIAKYENVYTDRLHVAIAATMLGKNVILYSNSYFKNESIFNYSLRHYPNVKFEYLETVSSAGHVSIVCAIMNREDMLRTSLFSWLKFKEIGEIIIVDWSSKKDLSWVLDIDERVKYIRVEGEDYFNISQAYNLGADHVTKDYILKMDVDYLLNPYYNFFDTNPVMKGCFYAGNSSDQQIGWDNPIFSYLNGILYTKTEDFKKIEGYNENFQGYGYDDDEIYENLQKIGLDRLDISYDYSVMHVPHPSNFRTSNYQKNLPDNRSVIFKKRRIVEWDLCEKSNRYTLAKIKPFGISIDKKNDSNWYKFEDEEEYDYTSACLEGDIDYWGLHLKGKMPENGIYKIESGIVFDDGMSICPKTLKPFIDIYWFTDNRHEKLSKKLYNRKTNNLIYKSGKCLNLCSPWADINYGHFVLDSITKLEIVEGCCPLKIDEFNYILMPTFKSKESGMLIDFFKIPRNKILYPTSDYQYQFDELYTPSLRGGPAITKPKSVDKIREAFDVKNRKPTKKLYISRKGFSRNIANEESVWSVLKDYGFEKINPKEVEDCPQLFNEASIIVGPHGAGLTNMIFCQSNTKIIELMPHSHRYTWYLSLAHACGLPYHGLICGDQDSFLVNIEKLKNILDSTLEEKNAENS